ncbi:MAG: ABC transporter permease [Chloroflexi bacterium]|nr:ABC transporter permease [Chloroflexota bacterium]
MLKYIAKRVIYFIPTLIVISIVSFLLIELPPGDYLTSYIAALEARGEMLDESGIASLRARYGLDQPLYLRYLKWITNFVRGDMGQSFEWGLPVSELIWSRVWLTFVVSLATMVFTWIIAFPIAIYSATHQYSLGDYFFSFIGFVGLGVPNFMIALILLWLAFSYFGADLSGLFSEEYAEAPWSLAKVVDLLKHMWVPLIVLGTSGAAGLIRTTRANLLDEMRKPYVTTARAKGLKEGKLLLKYPLRVALNPFISGIGYALPALISGSTIISVVLNLPMTGPLLLRALMSQDMYMAGSFLLLLSTLTVIGTLLSDILLGVVDPRIRYEES